MTIVADSSQWTGEHDDAAPAGPVVWGEFDDRETLDRAAGRLREEAWFREANARTEAAGEAGRADNDQIHAEILGACGSAFKKTAPTAACSRGSPSHARRWQASAGCGKVAASPAGAATAGRRSRSRSWLGERRRER